jgi:hypothetical protein
MLSIILFSAAITVVFTQGTLFKPLRDHGPKLWRDLASCALCTGVWVGAATWLLFSGFPHAGGKLEIARAVAVELGVGSVTGCVALLYVSVWDWLAKEPGIHVPSGATLSYNTRPELVPTEPAQPFPSSEAPTDPGNKRTQRMPLDKLVEQAEKSKREG